MLRGVGRRVTRVSTDIQLQALRGSAYAASPSQGGAISVGTEFHVERAFSAAEVSSFCSLSGDGNPIHTAEAAALAAGLPASVVPGILCASLFPAIIGSRLPGSMYLKQDLSFRNPALVGCAFAQRMHPMVQRAPPHLPCHQFSGAKRVAEDSAATGDPTLCREALKASVRITRLSGQRALFETSCLRLRDGKVVVDGTALALLPGTPA